MEGLCGLTKHSNTVAQKLHCGLIKGDLKSVLLGCFMLWCYLVVVCMLLPEQIASAVLSQDLPNKHSHNSVVMEVFTGGG